MEGGGGNGLKIGHDWQERSRRLQREAYAMYLAYHDPRVSRWAKLFALVVVAYALSPIDLIPDPIPVLGYLDDLLILPLGLAIARRLIPREVLEECRATAEARLSERRPRFLLAAAIVVAVWVAVAAVVGVVVVRLLDA